MDDAGIAIHHARRLLRKASVEGIERLEHHIGTALGELLEEQDDAERKMNALHEKADAPDA